MMHRPQAGPNERRLVAGAAFAIARAINGHTFISRILRLCRVGSDLREFIPACMNNPGSVLVQFIAVDPSKIQDLATVAAGYPSRLTLLDNVFPFMGELN